MAITKYKGAPKDSDQVVKAGTPTQADSLIQAIQAYIPQIQAALPRHLSAERMGRILMTEVRKNPLLAQCDKISFFGAILQCSQLGLEPGSALGHAYMIPRKRKDGSYEVTLQIGYQGMLDLVERDGRLTIEANLVFSNELFDIDLGTDAKIVHKPCLTGDRGNLLGAYAIARYKDGAKKFRFISIDEIEEAKTAAKIRDFSPWNTHYNEMARKTAVRRLYKMLPKSTEIARVLELEDKIDIDEPQNLQRLVVEAPNEVQGEVYNAEISLEQQEAMTEQK